MRPEVQSLEARIVLSTVSGSQIVAVSGTTTSVTPPAPITFNQLATFSATVADVATGSGTPTGQVTFFDGATSLRTVTLDGSGASAFYYGGFLSAGTHSITARYAGDANHSPSTSPVTTLTVNKMGGQETVTSMTPIGFGESATLTATMDYKYHGAGTPSGTVSFFDGPTQIGSAPLDVSGTNTILVPGLGAGSHSITARYSGDANFQPMTSAATILQVNKAETTATLAPPSSTVFGHAATFSTTVADSAPGEGTPTGMVTFFGGSNILGVAPLVNGTATLTVSAYPVSAGQHEIVGVYSGDANFILSVTQRIVETETDAGSVSALSLDGNYVQSLYQAVLGRAGTDAEVAAWAGSLGGGMGRQQVAEAFVNSAEHREDQVASYYREFLHRDSDSGSTVWVNELLAGVSEEKVMESFIDSAEYQAAHQDSALFAHDLYIDVLGRSGSPAEISGLQASLASGISRQAIAAYFVESSEADAQVIDSLYASYLHRQPDGPNPGPWKVILDAPGGSAGEVAVDILASPEFYEDSQDSLPT